MDLNKKLEELKPYQLNCNVFDVYSYNGLTMQDLLCQFFTKINDCITVSNETIDLAKWLVNEGLEIEVVKKLMIWLEDGTLENIINVNLFNTLNGKITDLKSQLDNDIKNVNDRLDYNPISQSRAIVRYKDKNSVYIDRKSFIMQGFRFMGSYTKFKGRYAELENNNNYVSFTSGLIHENNKTFNNWYAVFAIIPPNSDKAKLVLVPYLKVNSVLNKTVTLSKNGEGQYGNIDEVCEYDFKENSLNECDLLVITQNKKFNGRIAKINSHTNSTITIDNVETLVPGDMLLPSPQPNDYVYLTSFYLDTQEVRNIVDSGTIVKTRGVALSSLQNANGDLSSGKEFNCNGYISPLATSVIINIKQSLSTASTGSFNFTVGLDLNHDYHIAFNRKDVESTISSYDSQIICPFMFNQLFTLKTSGTLGTLPTRQIDIRGWIEP